MELSVAKSGASSDGGIQAADRKVTDTEALEGVYRSRDKHLDEFNIQELAEDKGVEEFAVGFEEPLTETNSAKQSLAS